MSARKQRTNRTSDAGSLRPYFDEAGITLYHGESLVILPTLGVEADAVITDPPYCSGGATAAERAQDPVKKYCHNNNALGRPSFSGDHLDQHAWAFWCRLWLSQCQALTRRGGYCLSFTDWRQLPTLTDVLQAGGFVWRGVIAWDKGRGARAPHKGYFRHQCEYVVWGTNGPCLKRTDGGPFDGCMTETVKQADKFHITGKPTRPMCQLVGCAPAGGLVVDPFAGSGTTAVACALTGRRFIGIEKEERNCAIAAHRLKQVLGRRAA